MKEESCSGIHENFMMGSPFIHTAHLSSQFSKMAFTKEFEY
jgi:hypothetical protein